ncbi:TRAP transporter large permease subunit [Trinickia dinghuensis]|uniref:ABC transporter permease n=1 Tax=Trinickia dinghuensis TaxID=2291023 RepID=A0A3D8JRA6_9BURK|nr:TRAP transporter large permease subunit [Trinickia dinghuensis]RDU95639.1 ABC transporter permease [Trinickia dinghuensis]
MSGTLSLGEHRPPLWQVRCDTALGWIVELPAALIVLAEVVVLLAGVISRFVFDYPLVWSDELASILFLWLAMLGSAVALRRGDHMRMTVLAQRLQPAWRAYAEALAVGAPCLFLAVMLGPSINYAQDQWVVQTPVMGIPDTIRVAAVPVGSVLMLAICCTQLARHRLRELVCALGTLAAIALALYFARNWIWGIGNWSLVIFFGVLLAAGVLGGLPIAFCFGLSTVACLLSTTTTPLAVITGQMNEGMSSLVLLAVPLFVLLGQLIVMTRMANAMVAFLAALLGHVKGGLSFVLIGAMVLVSGISGAKTADMAAVAPVLFPEMKKRGIPEGELVSLLAACGAMAETIPPSLVLIIIGSVTGVSIAALFTGGLLPGLVLAVALGVIARKRTGDLAGKAERASAKTVLKTFVVALPALVLPVLIRFVVADGVATATEVSTIGIAYTVVVGLLVYRHFDWRRIYPMLVETASLSGAILLIIGAATAMAWALTQASFSQALAQAMGHMPGGAWGFLFISVIAFIVLGSVLEGIPAMVLFGSLLFPMARQAGIHEVHYAITVILAMGIGLFTPPFGLGYYAACTIGRVDPNAGLRRIWPYLGALAVGLAAVAAIPWISTGFLS